MLRAEQDMLLSIASMNRAGIECLTTSRTHLKRVAIQLVESGHIFAQDCVLVAHDGFRVHPERWGVGYSLTETGMRWINNIEPDQSDGDCDRCEGFGYVEIWHDESTYSVVKCPKCKAGSQSGKKN